MARLEKLSITIGQALYCFKGTANMYTGAIATETGIAKTVTESLDEPDIAVKELIQSGIARRVSAVIRRADNTRGIIKLLVAKDKLATALEGLKGKSINTPRGVATIVSVGFPRRVTSRG